MDIKLSLDRQTLKKNIDKITEGNTSMTLAEFLTQLGVNPNELTYSIHEISTMNVKMAWEIMTDEMFQSSKPDIELIKNFIQHSQIKYLDDAISYLNCVLSWACNDGYEEIVEIILKQPNISKKVFLEDDDGYTPLLSAVSSKNTKIVELLLQHPKIDVNHYSKYQEMTALMEASEMGETEIVKLLLQHPDIDVNLYAVIPYESTIEIALRKGHKEIADLIKAHPKFDELLQDEEPETMIKRMKKAMEKKNITKMKLKGEYDPNFPRQWEYIPPFTQIRIEGGEVELCPDKEYDEDENSNWMDANWYLKYTDFETFEDIIEEIEQYGN